MKIRFAIVVHAWPDVVWIDTQNLSVTSHRLITKDDDCVPSFQNMAGTWNALNSVSVLLVSFILLWTAWKNTFTISHTLGKIVALRNVFTPTRNAVDLSIHRSNNEHISTWTNARIYVALAEKYTPNGVDTCTFMKHKHKRHTREW